MPTFSAADIVGKNLIAVKPVPLYRNTDFDTPIYTVEPGLTIGNVYSYLNSNAQRPFVTWMFYDSNGKTYFAKHKEGSMKIAPGSNVKSLEQKDKDAAAANQTTADKIIKTAINISLIIGGFILASKAIGSNSNT